MLVNYPADLTGFVAQQLADGCYATEEELLLDAVRALQHEKTSLQELIAEGMAHPENDYILESEEDLARFFDDMGAEIDRERSEMALRKKSQT
ncbi:MAG: hypothetical protein SH850_21880 [Planctomycetaceae bacterium]|nr:hypothetical protein [Planctomycetaceae bacterium]